MDQFNIAETWRAACATAGAANHMAVPTNALAEFARQVRAHEAEANAKLLEAAAARLTAAKRTNQVDRHVADVLERYAAGIRLGSEIAQPTQAVVG
jgi:hypothetical protein